MTHTPDSLRRDLADLSADAAKADRSAGEIHRAAEERHGVVQARMTELRPKVITDEAAATEYQALAEEHGQLALVLGRK